MIAEDREDTNLPNLDREHLPDFLLLVVAICHQTTPATGEPPLEGTVNGRMAKGWDYLLRKLASEAVHDTRWVRPSAWIAMRAEVLQSTLRDADKGDRLTDPEGRASLIRDLGEVMLAQGWRSVSDIHLLCDGRLAGRQPSIIEQLTKFRAYQDPVRKKSYYFLSMMQNFGLWSFADTEHLGPPADYHEVRGHLRIGTVRIDDPELLRRLIVRQRVSIDEDNRIRNAVVQAISAIARALGITPSRAHYMFWNVFRNICTRDDPQCFELRPGNPLPERYLPLTQLAPGGHGCPFATVCQSAGLVVMPKDPVVLTEFH